MSTSSTPLHRAVRRPRVVGLPPGAAPSTGVEARWREFDRTSLALARLQEDRGTSRPLRHRDLAPHPCGVWGRTSAQNLLRAHVEGLRTSRGAGVRVVPDHEAAAGELGCAVLESYDAVTGRRDRVVAHVISDVPLGACPSAAGWVGGDPLDPVEDGAVLTVLDVPRSRTAPRADAEVVAVVRAHGREPHLVDVDDGPVPHAALRAVLERSLREIGRVQDRHRSGAAPGGDDDLRWPVVVLRTPERWGRAPDRCGSRTR